MSTSESVSTSETAGILDTSVVIALGSLSSAALPRESFISAVTLAELSVGPLVAATDNDRVARQAVLQVAEAHFSPLPFDADSARVFGRVAAELRHAGRKRRARAYDALIAATAIRHGLALYTRNPEAFSDISGLIVRVVP